MLSLLLLLAPCEGVEGKMGEARPMIEAGMLE